MAGHEDGTRAVIVHTAEHHLQTLRVLRADSRAAGLRAYAGPAGRHGVHGGVQRPADRIDGN